VVRTTTGTTITASDTAPPSRRNAPLGDHDFIDEE
jgi:hypothetical protein